ncbi:hypothetical protein NL676_019652 [Syzygium grande]|nr:hypothetical protein NL676_019652 [Syzygium grande]
MRRQSPARLGSDPRIDPVPSPSTGAADVARSGKAMSPAGSRGRANTSLAARSSRCSSSSPNRPSANALSTL